MSGKEPVRVKDKIYCAECVEPGINPQAIVHYRNVKGFPYEILCDRCGKNHGGDKK